MVSEPCTPWPILWNCDICAQSPEVTGNAANSATSVLNALSGGQFGLCEYTIRPCRRECYRNAPWPGGWLPWPGREIWPQPALIGGLWYNLTCGSCHSGCSCTELSTAQLPDTIYEVVEVRVDGSPLVTGAYRLDGNLLVRLDGGTWPKCFSAETLVLTDDGLIPISAVQIGQRVLTHKNRWRRVLSSGQTGESETVTVAGTGGTLNCTSDHPFLSCDLYKPASSKEGRTKLGSASWVRADELVGKAWAIPVKIESLPLILPDGWTIHDLPNNFWWVIGRWIGDGWAESYSSRVTICCGIHERDQLKNELNDTGWLWRESGGSIHAPKFRFSNPALHSWLRKYFGTSAKTKKIPAWILGANYRIRDQILKGYMSADGEFSNRDNNRNGRLSAHTISRELAIGVKLLAATLGWSSRVYKHKAANPSTCRGRTITPRNDAYLINWSTGRPDTPYSQSWAADGQLWTRVRSVRLNEQIVPVYNLEVEEDNSFIANGFIVHNCNDLSKADTEVGTWSVRASYGRPVPVLGQIAMGDLACQFIKAIAGEDCELPRNIASLARQGMVINFANASTLMREGRTGIYTVDMFLNAVNPHGLRQRARTFSVDKDSRHRTVY